MAAEEHKAGLRVGTQFKPQAVGLGAFYPDFQLALLLVAVSIAASRIILGMHFLSDVLAGSVIGISLAYAFLYLFA